MQLKTDGIEDYLTDASNLPGGFAEKVLLPETAQEVAEILRDSNENGVAVTISGSRTGTVGGAVPFGGVVVSLEKLNKIRSISKDDRRAVVECGVLLTDLQKAVDAEGLFYPPDPTEWSCQIGGTVATNASGARSFKYGATRKFVERIEVALADGDFLDITRGENFAKNGLLNLTTRAGRTFSATLPTNPSLDVRKNCAGYFNLDETDAIDVFIGSEGTLGVVTAVEVKLLKKPESFLSGIVFFPEETGLLNFVEDVRGESFETRKGGEGIDATSIEYFDSNSLAFIRAKFPETPENMAGAIFFEQETTAENEEKLLERWNALFENHGADTDSSWFTTTNNEMEKMRTFRHALPVSVNERVVRNKQRKIGTDMAVPDENFRSFLKFYKDKLNASEIDHVIFGHIGDCHLHANLLPKTDEEAVASRHLYGRFIAQALMLGGTISAEHGVGKLKSEYLYVMMGERYLNEMADFKRAFDPKLTLSRRNIFGARI